MTRQLTRFKSKLNAIFRQVAVPTPGKTIYRPSRDHRDGVLRWFNRYLPNGFLEGIAGLAQAARARARGDPNVENFTAMIYVVAGKHRFHLPT